METHVRVAPISTSSFFHSRTNTPYGLRYLASSGLMIAPSRTYTSCTPTSRAFPASLACFTSWVCSPWLEQPVTLLQVAGQH